MRQILVERRGVEGWQILGTGTFLPPAIRHQSRKGPSWIGSNYNWRSCFYERNYPTQMRCFAWLRTWQNGVFHFEKTNCLCENEFIPPRSALTSTQVRSQLGGMIFLHINSFCRVVPHRQNCSFSLDSLYFYNYYVKKCNLAV